MPAELRGEKGPGGRGSRGVIISVWKGVMDLKSIGVRRRAGLFWPDRPEPSGRSAKGPVERLGPNGRAAFISRMRL